MTDIGDISVRVRGQTFQGWQAVTVRHQYAIAAGSFRLEVAPARSLPTVPGDRLEVLLGSEPVLTGYVDAVEAEGSTDGSSAVVYGRSLAADLVDCTVDRSQQTQWIEAPVTEIVASLLEPFGIPYQPEGLEHVPIWTTFDIEAAETAWSALQRALVGKQLVSYSRGDGTLVFGRPAERAAGVRVEYAQQGEPLTGRPVLAYHVRQDHSERFATYVLIGQHYGTDNGGAGYLTWDIDGRARDPDVARYRTLEIIGEQPYLPWEAEDRARLEAIARATRSFRVQATLPGWRRGPGLPAWTVGLQCPVLIREMGIDETLFIDAVTLSLREGEASTAGIELVRQDAYDPPPGPDLPPGASVVPQNPEPDGVSAAGPVPQEG